MTESKCQNCKYFRQHYVKRQKRFFPVNCGHCIRPRLKQRKPDTPACERFVPMPLSAGEMPQI